MNYSEFSGFCWHTLIKGKNDNMVLSDKFAIFHKTGYTKTVLDAGHRLFKEHFPNMELVLITYNEDEVRKVCYVRALEILKFDKEMKALKGRDYVPRKCVAVTYERYLDFYKTKAERDVCPVFTPDLDCDTVTSLSFCSNIPPGLGKTLLTCDIIKRIVMDVIRCPEEEDRRCMLRIDSRYNVMQYRKAFATVGLDFDEYVCDATGNQPIDNTKMVVLTDQYNMRTNVFEQYPMGAIYLLTRHTKHTQVRRDVES